MASTVQARDAANTVNAQDSTVHKNPVMFTTKKVSGPKCQQCRGKEPRSILLTLHHNFLARLPSLTEYECLTTAEDAPAFFISRDIFLARSTCSMGVFE